jgi:PEP-CTERM motif
MLGRQARRGPCKPSTKDIMSTHPRLVMRSACLAALALCLGSSANANLLNNGGFDLVEPLPGFATGWTYASYLGGDGYAEANVVFDTTGSSPSLAVRFGVGGNGAPGGLQLAQSFNVASAGAYDFAIDVATVNTGQLGQGGNVDGGTYLLAVDGVPVASFVVGPILSGLTVRGHLAGSSALTAGTHSFQLDMTRSFLAQNSGLWLYVDNALVQGSAVPEPASWTLLALGALALGWRRRPR